MCVTTTTMRVLEEIYTHPTFKKIFINEKLIKQENLILNMMESIESLIFENNITGKEIINSDGERHYTECPEAYVDVFETCEAENCCVCCTIENKFCELMTLLEEIEQKGTKTWIQKLKRSLTYSRNCV